MSGALERSWASTEEVCEAVGKAPSTVLRWAKLGVLPRFELVYARGKSVRWPRHAPEQARWVDEKLHDGWTFAEIRAALERGDFLPKTARKD